MLRRGTPTLSENGLKQIIYIYILFCHSLVSLDLNIFTVALVTISVLSLFQLSNTLVEKKLQRGAEVCCTWNLYGWLRLV